MSLYNQEIKSMMYSFGDVKNPLSESAAYIEDVVRSNIKYLINLSNGIRLLQRKKYICVEDICFALRKDPFKVKRIKDCIIYKKLKKNIKKDDNNIKVSDTSLEISFEWFKEPEGKDIYHLARLENIDKLTRKMTKKEYLEFTECRQASFIYKKNKIFKNFLGKSLLTEEARDVLAYVCYEMVYKIVNYTLRDREKRKRYSSKPISKYELENTVFQIIFFDKRTIY